MGTGTLLDLVLIRYSTCTTAPSIGWGPGQDFASVAAAGRQDDLVRQGNASTNRGRDAGRRQTLKVLRSLTAFFCAQDDTSRDYVLRLLFNSFTILQGPRVSFYAEPAPPPHAACTTQPAIY